MYVFKKFIDFYIYSSFHVALSCFSMVKITVMMFHIPNVEELSFFAFFGTVAGYNFIKYDASVRTKKVYFNRKLKAIVLVSFLSFLACGYFFLQLKRMTQVIALVFLGLTILYALPFFPNVRNARNWAGVKIYIVSLCWVGVTLVLPVIEAGVTVTEFFYWKCIQRFILILTLILIFEIIDLPNDDPHLHTVPQQIGLRRTKMLGYGLLLLFAIIEIFNNHIQLQDINILFIIEFLIAGIIALFLAFASSGRSKYYSTFWAESIPVVWFIMVYLFFR
ncbi:MAG TPA: hypothetical protein VF677_13895 [Flavobacterium sp.]